MFEDISHAHVFGLPCGVNYPEAVRDGLLARLKNARPDELARTEIFVNTSRMGRDLKAAFIRSGPSFIPQIKLFSELGRSQEHREFPPAISSLRRRLELSQLVSAFLQREHQFSAGSAAFDLADSLAGLLAEMEEEGVGADAIRSLKVHDASGHWEKSLHFLSIIFDFLEPNSAENLTSEAQQNQVLDAFEERWRRYPPNHPILIVGSTGSRAPMSRFMQMVARLPKGAVILPGFDFDIPNDVWARIGAEAISEHPQERFVRLIDNLDFKHAQVSAWDDKPAPSPDRNRLISLALRPAPITDQWMQEGPRFAQVGTACEALSLLEAPEQKLESDAIALALRNAVELGQRAALVTPDRDLARRVSAMLDRWKIAPDDSAGIPLNQTPPGRLLRHIAQGLGQNFAAEDLLVILKHPLCARGGDSDDHQRGYHLLWTRELEVYLRSGGPAFPAIEHLRKWAKQTASSSDDEKARNAWIAWIDMFQQSFMTARQRAAAEHLTHVLSLADLIVRGPKGSDSSELWAHDAGIETRRVVDEFAREAEYAGILTVHEFVQIFTALIGRGLARDPRPKNPDVMIWGTMEARALDADLVILGGLNEGIWPPAAGQDPWFSRDMRKQAGLTLPEQSIGLSAHDFQQAVGASQVILSRSKRDAETETVPSRWLIRLTNLMEGMSDTGREALSAMRERGDAWVNMARLLDVPSKTVPAAHRPSPRPPLKARPRQLSVTRIETLIRDPYEIYASRILRLKKLDPLNREPDPKTRGTVLHKIMEQFLSKQLEADNSVAKARLLATAEEILDDLVQWPSARRVWLARIRKIADGLIVRERARAKAGSVAKLEAKGATHFKSIDFSLTGTADRIDRAEDGRCLIYDYKTGDPPSAKQAEIFNIQLHLEAVMMRAGGFEDLTPSDVSTVAYLSLKEDLKEVSMPLDPETVSAVEEKLCQLIQAYDDFELGYTARRALMTMHFQTDFAHLSRYGEWDDADAPISEDVT